MGTFFEMSRVSRGEFEALRRFPDYEELADGTLSRVEGTKEFRIIADDVQGLGLGVMTPGLLNELRDTYPSTLEEIRKAKALNRVQQAPGKSEPGHPNHQQQQAAAALRNWRYREATGELDR